MNKTITSKQIRAFMLGYQSGLNSLRQMLVDGVAVSEMLNLDWDGKTMESPSFRNMSCEFYWANRTLDLDVLELFCHAYALAIDRVGAAWGRNLRDYGADDPCAPELDIAKAIKEADERHADRQLIVEDMLGEIGSMLHNIEYQKGYQRIPRTPEGTDAKP